MKKSSLRTISKILIFAIIFVILESNSIKGEPNIDRDVINALENNSMVEVSVTIIDLSGINLSSARNAEERHGIVLEQVHLNQLATEEFVKSLSEDEFVFTPRGRIGPGFFTGNITRKGLDKLEIDPRVLKIYIPKEANIDFNDGISSINDHNEVNNYSNNYDNLQNYNIFYYLKIGLIILFVLFFLIIFSVNKEKWFHVKK